jgi:hypothetical protein
MKFRLLLGLKKKRSKVGEEVLPVHTLDGRYIAVIYLVKKVVDIWQRLS